MVILSEATVLDDAVDAECELFDRLIAEAERFGASLNQGVARDTVGEVAVRLSEMRDDAIRRGDKLKRYETLRSAG